MYPVATIITYKQFARNLPSHGEEYRNFDKKVGKLNIITVCY